MREKRGKLKMVVIVIFPSINEIRAAKKNIIVGLHFALWHFVIHCFYTYEES
jgi:hypothetical protein